MASSLAEIIRWSRQEGGGAPPAAAREEDDEGEGLDRGLHAEQLGGGTKCPTAAKGKPAVAPPPRWPVTRALLAAAEEVAEMVHLLLSLLHQPPALLKAANGERGLGRGEEAAQGRGGGDWGEEERRGLGRSTRCANAGPGGLLATHG
jgi:hypothetical protein